MINSMNVRKRKINPFILRVAMALVVVTFAHITHINEIAVSLSSGIYDVKAKSITETLEKVRSSTDRYGGMVQSVRKEAIKKRSGGDSSRENHKYSEHYGLHPIDEFIKKETSEGSSLRILLRSLMDHSMPEAYGDEIKREDIEAETARCARYGFEYNPIISRRRRIFLGSLIADDSWHVIAAHAAEAYGLYHTVSLIESNTTQTMTKRETRFDEGSLNYRMLQSGIFGPRTDVYVDFRVDIARDYPHLDAFRRENLQRSHITQRWKEAGMQPNDIGIISDIDEVYTRDFLLALQSCDVPQFRPGQDCFQPQITGQGISFETSPDCQSMKKPFGHPNAMIGECIDRIGDSVVHTPGLRRFPIVRGGHLIGKRDFQEDPSRKMYPLWEPWDFRRSDRDHGITFEENNKHTAFHFHNFFDSFDSIRNKYKTYGHAVEGADSMPLSDLHYRSMSCFKGGWGEIGTFEQINGRTPILWNEAYRIARHKEMKDEVEADEMGFRTSSDS